MAKLPGRETLGWCRYRLRDHKRAFGASDDDTTRSWLVGALIVLASIMGAWLLVNRRFRKVAR